MSIAAISTARFSVLSTSNAIAGKVSHVGSSKKDHIGGDLREASERMEAIEKKLVEIERSNHGDK